MAHLAGLLVDEFVHPRLDAVDLAAIRHELGVEGEASVGIPGVEGGEDLLIGSYPHEIAGLVAPGAMERPTKRAIDLAIDVVRSLSRRELVILRTLTEGASNKIIARKLVITESTVKVHMKAILRKLRLQNRTQAAIWARTHLGALLENAAA